MPKHSIEGAVGGEIIHIVIGEHHRMAGDVKVALSLEGIDGILNRKAGQETSVRHGNRAFSGRHLV